MQFFSKEVISNPCLNKDPQPGMNSGCLKNHKSTNKTKNTLTAASSNLRKDYLRLNQSRFLAINILLCLFLKYQVYAVPHWS